MLLALHAEGACLHTRIYSEAPAATSLPRRLAVRHTALADTVYVLRSAINNQFHGNGLQQGASLGIFNAMTGNISGRTIAFQNGDLSCEPLWLSRCCRVSHYAGHVCSHACCVLVPEADGAR